MSTFQVICKANGNNWAITPTPTRTVTTTLLFGLFKSTKIVSDLNRVPGPAKEEICIVIETYIDGEKYYKLAGYPYGGYNSKYFIRMDEFYETATEIEKVCLPIHKQ